MRSAVRTFADLLTAHAFAFVVLSALLGLAVGSFLNVVIHRLPRMLEGQWRAEYAEMQGEPPADAPRYNLFTPRSACPKCEHRLSALENVPILSYLWLRGRCAACGTDISVRYPLVEASSGALSAYIAWHFGFGWSALAFMVFAWCMIALAFIDLDTLYLPDSVTLLLLWLGLIAHALQLLPQLGVTLTDAVIGAAAGYLCLWSVFWVFKLVTGKEGMGYGDFKLLAAIGAWLGWKALPLVILLSSVVGAAVGIVLIVLRRQGREVPIPFGPYLVVAGLIALFWGDTITRKYLDFL